MPSSRLEVVVDGVKFGVEVEDHNYPGVWLGWLIGGWVGGLK